MRTLRRAWPALLAPLFLTGGCLSDCCSSPENLLNLFVGVQIDSATFRSDGYVLLELIPTNDFGETFVTDPWHIVATLDEPTAVPVTTDTQWVQPADPRPLAAAILIDDSGSMLKNDPDRERASAAKLFANQFLAPNPENRAALADFGWPTDSATPGFARTRLLQGYTADQALIDAGAARIEGIEGGGSHLYQSALEVAQWTSTAAPPTSRRMLVIVTDGYPSSSDTTYRDAMFAEVAAQEIRILSVGIGPASDQTGVSVDSAVALVQELASQTGGVYSGATSSTQLLSVLTAFANVSTSNQLLVLLRLSQVPPRGTKLVGTVTISGQRGRATAQWSAVAP